MSPPRVSVIIIFLNAERFLSEAVESVLAQTFTDFELILVDDGSDEPCRALARRYAERDAPRVRYLEHQGHQNRGMSASRNLGIAASRGEYIAFIDADDVWSPNKLGEQVAIMDARPDLGMSCGAVRYWRSWDGRKDAIIATGHVHNRVIHPPEACLAVYPLGRAVAPCPSDMMLRRSVVVAIGGFEEQFTGMYEDQAFLMKLYLATPVFFSDKVWLDYRQHADSISAQVKREGYLAVRRYFLNWLAGYLAGLPGVDPRVEAALGRARWRSQPIVYASTQVYAELLRWGRRVGRGVKRLKSSFAR